MSLLTKMEFMKFKGKYGDFVFSEGVRSKSRLKEGYKYLELDDNSGVLCSVSVECILDVFYEMINLMDGEVVVVLESNHTVNVIDEIGKIDVVPHNGEIKKYAGLIDTVVLKSVLVEYEELIVNDGFFGISMFDRDSGYEIQLDRHKTLIGFGDDLEKFVEIFEMYGLVNDEKMLMMGEVNHIHLSKNEYKNKVNELVIKLGVEYCA